MKRPSPRDNTWAWVITQRTGQTAVDSACPVECCRPRTHPAEWVTLAIGVVLALTWLAERLGLTNFTGA